MTKSCRSYKMFLRYKQKMHLEANTLRGLLVKTCIKSLVMTLLSSTKTMWSVFSPEHCVVCVGACRLLWTIQVTLIVSFPLVVFLHSSLNSFLLYTMSSTRMTSWQDHSRDRLWQTAHSYSRAVLASHMNSRNELGVCLLVAGTGTQLLTKRGGRNIAALCNSTSSTEGWGEDVSALGCSRGPLS